MTDDILKGQRIATQEYIGGQNQTLMSEITELKKTTQKLDERLKKVQDVVEYPIRRKVAEQALDDFREAISRRKEEMMRRKKEAQLLEEQNRQKALGTQAKQRKMLPLVEPVELKPDETTNNKE